MRKPMILSVMLGIVVTSHTSYAQNSTSRPPSAQSQRNQPAQIVPNPCAPNDYSCRYGSVVTGRSGRAGGGGNTLSNVFGIIKATGDLLNSLGGNNVNATPAPYDVSHGSDETFHGQPSLSPGPLDPGSLLANTADNINGLKDSAARRARMSPDAFDSWVKNDFEPLVEKIADKYADKYPGLTPWIKSTEAVLNMLDVSNSAYVDVDALQTSYSTLMAIAPLVPGFGEEAEVALALAQQIQGNLEAALYQAGLSRKDVTGIENKGIQDALDYFNAYTIAEAWYESALSFEDSLINSLDDGSGDGYFPEGDGFEGDGGGSICLNLDRHRSVPVGAYKISI